MGRPTLHTARWVLPVSREPIENGGVAVYDGRIAAVGAKRELSPQFGQVVDHGEGVIMPALINCHCHLELSPLRDARGRAEGFAPWLEWVVSERERLTLPQVKEGVLAAVAETLAAGTCVVADITNTGAAISPLGNSSLGALILIERLGLFSSVGEAEGIELEGLTGSPARGVAFGFAAHAPYSTSAALIRALKREAKRFGRLFSIHLAESAEEVRFLRDGTGPMREFLARRGLPVEDWQPPGMSPVEYVESLGVLDESTLVVHAVELEGRDIEMLARSEAAVCFCPRSNANLGLGRAAIGKILEAGIPAGLGTDSLASNHDLSIFGEISFLADKFPELTPKRIVEMATTGGAEIVGASQSLGSIEPGKAARLLFVPTEDNWTSPYDAAVAFNDMSSLKWIDLEEDNET